MAADLGVIEQVSRRKHDTNNDHRVLSFRQWCELNGFSISTGRRILAGGNGPIVTQLSKRRIGITIANNAAWQESRARG